MPYSRTCRRLEYSRTLVQFLPYHLSHGQSTSRGSSREGPRKGGAQLPVQCSEVGDSSLREPRDDATRGGVPRWCCGIPSQSALFAPGGDVGVFDACVSVFWEDLRLGSDIKRGLLCQRGRGNEIVNAMVDESTPHFAHEGGWAAAQGWREHTQLLLQDQGTRASGGSGGGWLQVNSALPGRARRHHMGSCSRRLRQPSWGVELRSSNTYAGLWWWEMDRQAEVHD